MTGKEIIVETQKMRGWSQSQLAVEAGYKSQSNVTGILNRGRSLNLDTFLNLINVMGFEVVVRDKMGTKKEWIITKEEK